MKNITLLITVFTLFSFSLFAQNVGINTDTPETTLQVNGGALIENASSASNPHLEVRDTGDGFGRIKFSQPSSLTDNYWTMAGRAKTADIDSRFNLYYSGDTVVGNLFVVTGIGNVGINKGDPSDRLHIDVPTGQNPLRVQINNQTKLRVQTNGGISLGINNVNGTPTNGLYVHGNTGIGFSNPSEKLAVNGDVNINGAIKAAGVNGTPGQMLVTGSDGDIAWASSCHYNRFIGFGQAQTLPWLVPADVTEISIECWGAGGGGANGGGGGSGGYAKGIFTVIPGETLSVVTGAGGVGALAGITTIADDGGSSTVTGNAVFIAGAGGGGATTVDQGDRGIWAINPPYLSAAVRFGESGQKNVNTPFFSGTNKLTYGRGGQSPFTTKNYGEGEIGIFSGGAPSFQPGSSGQIPGGGGGGGGNFNAFGNNGADGYVIIRWNN